MPRPIHRRSAPKVRNGTVQYKNNWALTPDYRVVSQPRVVIDRQRPGTGYRHLLFKRDIERFIALLPDWQELSQGLNAIVLAPGYPNLFGWHRPGIVALCAWERELILDLTISSVAEHLTIFDRLGIGYEWQDASPSDPDDRPFYRCHFTEQSARSFQLLHVLLHELGHHKDRMTTRTRRDADRGEDYAEQYANAYADRIWESFIREFGW